MGSRASGNGGTEPVRRAWVPAWVKGVGAAVWVTDPKGRIGFINQRAERVLGQDRDAVLGRPCHEVVCGRDEFDRPFCGSLCAMRSRMKAGKPLEPVRMRIPGGGKRGHWVQLLAIACHGPKKTERYLVHCVIDGERLHRLEEYLTRVATREPTENKAPSQLTPRERQILRLLSRDCTLHAIACELDLSYTTVRNHVQHILRKYRVHSVHEAVAVHLLQDE